MGQSSYAPRGPVRGARANWVAEHLPPGRVIIVDQRIARTVFHVTVANAHLRPGVRTQYVAAWQEFTAWMHPATGVIRLAQAVLAERTDLPLITVKRFFRFCRDNELIWKVVHQRFSHDAAVSGLAAGYVVLGDTRS